MTGQNDGTTTLKAAATDSVDKHVDDACEDDTADESHTAVAAAQTTTTITTGDQFDAKYQQFKGDPEKMQQMNDFVSGLLDSAEKEAETKLVARKLETKKGRDGRSSIFTGMRRGRMLTRARTVVVRWFEAICNCTTNTAASPIARNQAGRPILQKANTVAH